MEKLIIGNVIALIASLLMTYSGVVKNKKKVIFIQTIQIILFAIGNFVLGSISGGINNVTAAIRNIMYYKDKLGIKAKLILIILTTLISLYFNNIGIIGLLPILSTVIYTLFMTIKDMVAFKYLMIIVMIIWLIHDVCIMSYTSAIFDILSVFSNMLGIYRINKEKNIKVEN